MAAMLLAACSRLESPEVGGELVVAVRDTPLFAPVPPLQAKEGYEHDLLAGFAKSLGAKLRLIRAGNPKEQEALMAGGQVHLLASMPADALSDSLRYSGPVVESRQVLVQHPDALDINDLSDIAGKPVEVLAGSPLAATLAALDEKRRPLVLEQPIQGELSLLERVASGQSPMAATDLLHYQIAVSYTPDLRVALELPNTTRFAWAFSREGGDELRKKADAYLAQARKDGTLTRLYDGYFGHIRRINTVGITQFLERIRNVLPRFRADFEAAAEITGIDWRLLAALAYQESTWDPLATSPTGVRGMMMLTEDTADHLRVKNRLDPRESIRAGARYLSDLKDELPPEVKEPDRQWLALAAYNLGMGHLNGGRAIARGLKRNPNTWYDLKQVLPMMSRPEIYERLKSGRARGGEAVVMVENIHTFYDILVRLAPASRSGLRPPSPGLTPGYGLSVSELPM